MAEKSTAQEETTTIYKPKPESKPSTKYLKADKQKNATIGEISIIPIGGIILLKGAKNISLKFLKKRNGSLFQLIVGIHDKRINTNNNKNIKSNIPATAAVIPIFDTPYHLQSFYHLAELLQEQFITSSSIFSIILNKSF